MYDFFEKMMELEQRKLEEFKKFSELPNAQKIEYLNQKLDWENYDKIKYDFTLGILNNYHIDDEVLREIWKDWLKITLYQEFMIRDGIVCFFYRNPELKPQMIAELNRLIENSPAKVYDLQGELIDDKPVYIAGLVLWDLGYKKALQDFIKKYKKECDLYFDEDDYRKINKLEEEYVMS